MFWKPTCGYESSGGKTETTHLGWSTYHHSYKSYPHVRSFSLPTTQWEGKESEWVSTTSESERDNAERRGRGG